MVPLPHGQPEGGRDAGNPVPSRPGPQVMVDPRLLQANERTFLAWIRTAVGLMAFGFVIARMGLWLRMLEHEEAPARPVSVLIGAGVVAFASLLSAAAAARFVSIRRSLRAGIAPEIGPGLELALAVAIGALGVSLAAYLLLR